MNTGSVLAEFNVTLSKAVAEPVAVDWYTSDGTAKATVDYQPNKGTVLFAPGETSKKVQILVYGRAVGTEDRSFFVEMLPPTNAILGASIGECLIHVDASGSQPVTQIIVPSGDKGDKGDSAYETWLQLPGNAGKTEQEFIDSLKPSADEIAQEVAPLLDVGDTVLTAEGTASLSKPDATTVKVLARRVAYASPVKIATVVLSDGANTLTAANLSGDAVKFSASGFIPRVLHNGVFSEPKWQLNENGSITVFGAVAGDTLYATQYDFVSDFNSREAILSLAEKSLFVRLKSFEKGQKVSNASEVLLWEGAPAGQGPYFQWAGALPKDVPEGSTPASAGGVAPGAWVDVGDASLKYQLIKRGSFVKTDATNVLITPDAPANKSIPLNVFAQRFISLASFTGITGDGVTDDRAGIQAAIDACAAANVKLYIPAGTYAFKNWFSLPSNAHIEFDENAWFKLLNNTTLPGKTSGMGGFQLIGYNYNDAYMPDGTTLKQVEGVNIVTVGMKLDCNNIAGENGICGVFCSGVRHIRPQVKNTLHTDEKLGGRAFQWEGNVVKDVLVEGAIIEDCSIGCNSQGLVGSTTKNVRAVTYNGINWRNVAVPVMIYGQAANPDLADALIHSVAIFNGFGHNCGATRFSSIPSGGGLICSDRGAGLFIDGFRIVNDADYGAIGAIFRGPMFNVEMLNANIEAPYIVAPIDHSPVSFGSPSGASFNSFIRTRNLKVTANFDLIAKSTSTGIGPHDIEMDFDLAKATIANLFDANIASTAAANNAMITLTDFKTGVSTGLRSFRDLMLAGNTPAACMKRKDGIGTWTPSDVSGAGLALTTTGIQRYVREGETITLWLDVTFPTNSSGSAVAISGLPMNGLTGVTYAGIAPVVNGPSGSLAAISGGGSFLRLITASGGNVTNADVSGRRVIVQLRYAV